MSADGFVDDDTRESVASARAAAGEMFVAARSKLRRVFIVFAVGLVATIFAMRLWIWPTLKRDLLVRGADVVATTPFEVILLQAKIGLVVGILLSIPFFLYYAREPLKRRGWYPEEGVDTWKLALIGGLSVILFVGGIAYSYALFFPIMFAFLANNAISAGLSPTYSIARWTEFILVLGFSFGLAAQLPLAMTALSYTGIVPYETFREKWKYAIVGMFAFGAVFSPPDPFTQLMWAAPLVALYAFSLYLARIAAAVRRGGETVDLVGVLRSRANKLAAAFVLVAGVTAWLLTSGVFLLNRLIASLPVGAGFGPLRPEAALPLSGLAGVAVVAVPLGLAAALLAASYYVWEAFESIEAGTGRPAAIDIGELDAEGVWAAPPEVFEEMEPEEATALAQEEIDVENYEKAHAIFERFDEVHAGDGTEDETEEETLGGGLTSATTSVADAVSEEEVTEEEVGGYYYDIAFVLDSIRSKAFRIVAVFLGVLVGVFSFLYAGGIGAIKRDFIGRIPQAVRPEEVSVITLHPVEALVFEVKIATLLGLVATLPFLLYYAWPALEERGVASGDRNVFFGWGGAILGGLLVGSALGYLYVAPAVVSYFVWDALRADMVILYRVSNFFWLVFFTTVGIGIWLDIPITMVLFHRGGIVSYRTMRERWRGVLLGVMAAAAVFTPASVLSMILVAVPVMAGYAVGLGILWVYTLGGRRTPRGAPESG